MASQVPPADFTYDVTGEDYDVTNETTTDDLLLECAVKRTHAHYLQKIGSRSRKMSDSLNLRARCIGGYKTGTLRQNDVDEELETFERRFDEIVLRRVEWTESETSSKKPSLDSLGNSIFGSSISGESDSESLTTDNVSGIRTRSGTSASSTDAVFTEPILTDGIRTVDDLRPRNWLQRRNALYEETSHDKKMILRIMTHYREYKNMEKIF